MIKAIIFDCFGVVISDTPEAAYTSLGGNYEKDLPEINKIRLAVDKGEIASSHEGMAKLLNVTPSTYATAVSSGRVVNQELLDYIREELNNKYKVSMLSNTAKGRLPEIFGAGFLERYFNDVVMSGEIGYAKPEAEAYEIAADRLGVRLDECIFIDDRQEYVDGAIAVGMKSILFTSANQLKNKLTEIL